MEIGQTVIDSSTVQVIVAGAPHEAMASGPRIGGSKKSRLRSECRRRKSRGPTIYRTPH
jgi:hypothetical protein